MADVKSTTANLGLIKYSRGHPVTDTDLATNMDLVDAAYQGGIKVVKGDLVAGAVNTYPFTWQNPESSAILVQRVIVDVVTDSTAASLMDVGVVANATSTAALIFDNLPLTTVGIYDHTLVAGTGLGGVHKVDANGGTNDWITGKATAEASTALVGKYYIEYVVV